MDLQPSPWIADDDASSVMPVSGEPVCDEEARTPELHHEEELT